MVKILMNQRSINPNQIIKVGMKVRGVLIRVYTPNASLKCKWDIRAMVLT